MVCRSKKKKEELKMELFVLHWFNTEGDPSLSSDMGMCTFETLHEAITYLHTEFAPLQFTIRPGQVLSVDTYRYKINVLSVRVSVE